MILKINVNSVNVLLLKKYFKLSDNTLLFTEELYQKIKQYQTDHNLLVDGIVGKQTWQSIFGKNTELTNIDNVKSELPENIFIQLLDTMLIYPQLNNNLILCHFLSQCSHESGNFKVLEENLNYSAKRLRQIFPYYFKTDNIANEYAYKKESIANRVYANRMGNGDENSGDGYKYRGRGVIQLTGKDNYTKFNKIIGGDVINNPDLIKTKYAVLSAAYYFNVTSLWNICLQGVSTNVIKQVTKKINGGYNGLDDRINRFNKYKLLLLK